MSEPATVVVSVVSALEHGLMARTAERAALSQLAETKAVIGIFGPPGVGKTHLALEVFGDEAVLVSLADLETREEVRRAVARALAVEPGDSASSAALERAVEHWCGVLILDAADRAAPTLEGLLESWAGALVVLTSRARLSFGASFELGQLTLKGAHELWRRSCAMLGHRSDVTLAAAILEHLDGLPREVEWAASRAALLGDRACLERLSKLHDRRPGAALDDSLDLLDDSMADALEHVASFRAGAAVPCLERLGVSLDSLDGLRRRSLVHIRRTVDPPQVAAFRPVAIAVRARAIAQGSWERVVRAHAAATLDASRPERADLEAVYERCGDARPELAMRAALRLLPMDLADGSPQAAATRVRSMLSSIKKNELRNEARLGLARCARRSGELGAARKLLEAAGDGFAALLERAHLDRQESQTELAMQGYESALALARADTDEASLALALGEMGRMLQSVGRPRAAQALHLEAIALAHSSGDAEREALERSLYARAVHRSGAPAEAIPLHERALEMHLSMLHARLAAAERGHLAFCHHEMGVVDEAERLFRQSVDGLAAVGDVVLESIERVLLARLLGDVGRTAEARVELALARTHTLGMPRVELTSHFVAGLIEAREGRLELARDEWRLGVSLGFHQEIGFEALLPIHLAWVEHELRGEPVVVESLGEVAPGTLAAFELLDAVIRERPSPSLVDGIEETSSDVRRARALTASRGSLELSADGRFARLPSGAKVDLSRRNAPRRILCALAAAHVQRPGESLSREELIVAGWPGERIRHDAADKRLRTAIWTLRKAGLEPVLLTRDNGYLLDPLVSVNRPT